MEYKSTTDTSIVYRPSSNREEWEDMLKQVKKDGIVQVDDNVYWHFLEVLPPLCMNNARGGGNAFLSSEPYTYTDHGATYYGGIEQGNKYFLYYGTKNDYLKNYAS